MKDQSDWMLHPDCVPGDLCSIGSHECRPVCLSADTSPADVLYVSWRPDPNAIDVDAFSLDWTKCQGYANPPWNLIISRVVAQVWGVIIILLVVLVVVRSALMILAYFRHLFIQHLGTS